MPKFLKSVDLNGQRATNAGDGTANTDLTTVQQLNSAIRGLDWKAEVIAASTGNVSVSAPGTTVDGVTISASMQVVPNIGTVTRILLKNQSTAGENGIYDWNGGAAAMTRSVDADTWLELSGSTVTVQQGTVNADRVYRASSNDTTGTLGTTDPAFVQVGAASSSYIGGAGLTLTGSTFDVVGGTGITVAADLVSVDTSVVARKFAANCAATTNPQTFAHGLGTADLSVLVRESAVVVYPDVSIDATNVTVDWGAAPTAAQYRVIAVG